MWGPDCQQTCPADRIAEVGVNLAHNGIDCGLIPGSRLKNDLWVTGTRMSGVPDVVSILGADIGATRIPWEEEDLEGECCRSRS